MAKKTKKQKEQESRAYLMYLKDLEIRNKGLIKDKYPEIKSIIFEMNYIDADFLTTPHSTTYVRNPNNNAYFYFSCPYEECVDGGHDLDLVVYNMFKDKTNEQTGSLTCQGWQDKNRINKNRCLCDLNYKIVIEYNK